MHAQEGHFEQSPVGVPIFDFPYRTKLDAIVIPSSIRDHLINCELVGSRLECQPLAALEGDWFNPFRCCKQTGRPPTIPPLSPREIAAHGDDCRIGFSAVDDRDPYEWGL
jgi:hypothetical protein